MKLTSLLAGIVAVLGVLAGLLAPKSAEALVYSVHIELWPGGGSTLTCGWHSGPCYDNDALVSSGAALDWAPSSNISFYTKSSTDSPQFAVAGNGFTSSLEQSTCSHRRYASVYDNNSAWRAGVHYIHTAGSGTSTIPINTAQYTSAETSSVIGATAYEGGCVSSNGLPTWTDYHVHQLSDGGWTLANYPDHSTCNRPNIITDCLVANRYSMGYADWNVAYP